MGIILYECLMSACAANESDINTWGEIPYLQATACYSVYYKNIIMTSFLRFSKDFRTLSEDLGWFSKSCLKATQSFLNISEKFRTDCRRFPRKNRLCFDHTGTHLNIYIYIFLWNNVTQQWWSFHFWKKCVIFTYENIMSVYAKAHLVFLSFMS